MPDNDSVVQAATEVANLAGRRALESFRQFPTVDWKADGSPVTEADRDAERIAREWIMARFPDDGIVGEEFGTHKPNARRRWFVDPIDGTKAYIHGVPLWGTLVGVVSGNDVIAGAASFPAMEETLCAQIGGGCWWNGSRARVSDTAEIGAATVLTSDERFTATPERANAWRALSSRARVSRSWGDCCGHLLVATGRAEVMVDPIVSPWDIAALYPCVVEAGGVFTDWGGGATVFGGSAITSNAVLAETARALLRSV